MITGGVVSTKVMVCEQVALLVQVSVAVQVRRKIRTAGQSAGSSESTKGRSGVGSQVAGAVGLPKSGTAPTTHSLVRSGGQVITGGVVSMKVMVCEQAALLVQSSIAIQVRRKMRTAGQLGGTTSSKKIIVRLVS